MIRFLDATTVGVIAAGEVVERPQSVVKELVENALDAGASRIAVVVRHGGFETIEVSDDGAGIAAGELPLAFARHATSKLASAGDLERVATLGFRGEGLASIAAVARVRLISRIASDELGYAADAHAGNVGAPEPVAAPPGTRVVVRDLFANVPVRREYARAPSTEFARISTFLATLALAYPAVTFSLTHDGRSTFVFSSGDDLAPRLAHVFGADGARALVALEGHEGDPIRVRGFISAPGSDRPDRRMQLLFVNGRLLRSTLLAGAWSAGYATFALAGRQPFGVLFLDVPPSQVDPNVHPTKSDVRLRHPDAVHTAVRKALATTLGRHASARFHTALSFAPAPGAFANGTPDESGARAYEPAPLPWQSGVADERAGAALPRPADLRILAQLDDTYVLATDGSALVLVDQHAAHERVAYEAIAERARNGAPVAEPLLVPYTIDLSACEAERFEAARPALEATGLEAEPFGERAYRITATPGGYGARAFDLRGVIADLGDEIAGLDARERAWASLACHSVVRAGDRLEAGEMAALVAQLGRCRNPMHCPHGRPTIVRIEADAIARLFKRT